MIWKIVTEVHKIKIHTKYQRPGPSSFRQEDIFFKVLPIGICAKIDFSVKNVKVNPRLLFLKFYWAHVPNAAYQSRSAHWLWRSAWSCVPDVAKKLSFPHPWRLRMKFGFEWSSVLEKILKGFFSLKMVYVKQLTTGAVPFLTLGLRFEQFW